MAGRNSRTKAIGKRKARAPHQPADLPKLPPKPKADNDLPHIFGRWGW